MNKSTQILTRWNLSKIESDELNTLKQNLETHKSEVTKAQQQFDRLVGEENWKKARADRFDKVHSLFELCREEIEIRSKE